MATLICLLCVVILCQLEEKKKEMQKFYDATCTGCYLLGIITIYFQSNSGNHTHTHTYIYGDIHVSSNKSS